MKIMQMLIITKYQLLGNSREILLFISEAAAEKYLNEYYPGNVENTEEIEKEQYRKFTHEKPQFDNNGDYDYPIISTIILEWATVIE
jgi:hypothetical protein